MAETLIGSLMQGVVQVIEASEPRYTAWSPDAEVGFTRVRAFKWKDANEDELNACLVQPVVDETADATATTSEESKRLVLNLRITARMIDADELGEVLVVLDEIACTALRETSSTGDYPWSEIGFGEGVWDDDSGPDQGTFVRTIFVYYHEPRE